ncbi:type IV toxin-antitoxin system AbiEi family antitoxin domain-containing protein [Rhodomicrobium vannielii]|uniref:type IV toxin-antitoxin system AbiEi family antitoxin domain-containing protein n=1 Tax=Rhodomicrobium vannielii TaxID=1069 RepID=UPI001FDA6DF9|nr:type IV toxin-antitoxin system AbiEi family antitoxin domain-containing protein [Rhodomicrobium vannielii]
MELTYTPFHIMLAAVNTRYPTQQDRAIALLAERGMAKLSEFTASGITAATISRMKERGLILQLSRGLYQLPDAPLDGNHSLAEAAKRVPKGVICLVSALAYHELTDTIPRLVWIAIGARQKKPVVKTPPLNIVRFGQMVFSTGIEEHMIEGVRVRIYSPAKTVVDLFRYRQREGRRYKSSPGINPVLEGMREALRQRKATPADIARYAMEAGVWSNLRPYLEAMTSHA